jgi:hypothetical protein
MKKHIAHNFYFKNKEKIEKWLDLALYRPEINVPDKIPGKLNANKNRNFRRFCLLRNQLRMLQLADLSDSKKVLDIGAGYGDFSIFADNFNFEKIDATEPNINHYKFITEKFNYYNNVYNLPLEEIDMSEYDTVILSGIWVPNWVEVIKKYILPNKDLKNVIIKTKLLSDKKHLFLDAENINPTPWKYCFEGDKKAVSIQLMNLMFKSQNFYLKNSFSHKDVSKTSMTSKFYLHYRRE